jgi:hypothetical protein
MKTLLECLLAHRHATCEPCNRCRRTSSWSCPTPRFVYRMLAHAIESVKGRKKALVFGRAITACSALDSSSLFYRYYPSKDPLMLPLACARRVARSAYFNVTSEARAADGSSVCRVSSATMHASITQLAYCATHSRATLAPCQ